MGPTSIMESPGAVWTGQELVIWDISSNQAAAYAPDLDTWRSLPSIDLTGDTGVLRWTGELLYAFADTMGSYPSDTALQAARLNQEGGWEAYSPAEFSTDDLDVAANARLIAWAGDSFIAWTDSGLAGKTLELSPSDGIWTETEAVPIQACEGQGRADPGRDADRRLRPLRVGGRLLRARIPAAGPRQRWSGIRQLGYTVWTGTDLLNWGGGCCYTVDAWRLQPPA